MPVAILMPALSPTMTEGTLARWLKKEGEKIKAGQVIAEIETDKATMEVEAVDEGILAKIVVPGGSANVAVNRLIAVLLEDGEAAASVEAFIAQHSGGEMKGSVSAQDTVAPVSSTAPQGASTATNREQGSAGQRVFASPLARRLAKEAGVDLSRIQGTGPRGRVVKADIEQARQNGGGQVSCTKTSSTPCSIRGADGLPSYRAEPLSGMRKVIAQRLSLSKQTIPHFYLTIDVEMDALLKLRESINQAQEGVKVSVNDMLIKACGLALCQVPEANAMWAESEIRYFEAADVSVAVAIEGGLVTPVVRDVDTKPLLEVSRDIKRLADAARQGKLKPEEWQGGTFTLSNLGMFGIQEFGAIINPPQACILAVGTSERKPVIRPNDVMEIATVMKATLSADHRVVDGAVGAKFMQALRDILQKPLRLVI